MFVHVFPAYRRTSDCTPFGSGLSATLAWFPLTTFNSDLLTFTILHKPSSPAGRCFQLFAKLSKGGIRKRNQAPYLVKGFRLFDKVLYQGESYFIFGRRITGYFDIRTLDGTKVNKGSTSYKKLRIQDTAEAYLTEVRAIPHMNEFTCVLA